MHKDGNVGIFVLLKLEIKVDTVVIYVYCDSKYDAKCKFSLTFSQLVTITNLFLFEVEQKCQHCQLCVLRENLNRKLIKPLF